MQSTFVHRFAEAFGSYNTLSHESLCLIAGTRAFLDTFGEVPIPDMLYTKYVVMCRSQPLRVPGHRQTAWT